MTGLADGTEADGRLYGHQEYLLRAMMREQADRFFRDL